MPRLLLGRRGRASETGLSLIEVLVTALLLALVVGAFLPLLTSGQQGYDYGRKRQAMIQTGRVALDKLIREMRAAESFRTLASGQIVFTLDWGDGTGAQPTAQYSLDGTTHNLEYRWSADYDYREPITVRAQNAVAAGYAVPVTFNHASLVTAGKSLANGDDVRVRYWNGSAMIELDRVLDPTSAWNRTTTTLWFPLQSAIAAGGTNANYYLYYGNLTDSNPPSYGPNVFLDHQNGTALPPRVALEPVVTLGAETAGTRSDTLAALAGPFRSLSVACFDATNASIACAPATPVRAVKVTLVVMDPTGAPPDITLTDEAFRQRP